MLRIIALSKDPDVVNPVDVMKWTVVDDPKSSIPEEYENIGFIDFNFNDFDAGNIWNDNAH